ncbi:MAG: hypothetical protein ACQESD_08090 [Thermoplasmatota archaeon]
MNDILDFGDGWRRDLKFFLFSITPAIIALIIIFMMGSGVYLSLLAVLVNFYFAIGLGWITSPVVGLSTGVHPFWLLVFMVFVATESSLIVSLNYDVLEKVPLLGRGIRYTREKAEEVIEKHELAQSVSYFTLFWLMFIPIYGTGPMVMSFIGRILALDWWKVWVTISLSALTRYSLIIGLVYYGIFN